MGDAALSASIRFTIAARRPPGLVLGLAPGGAAGRGLQGGGRGLAVRPRLLSEREQPTETYVESEVRVRLTDGRAVQALVFLSDMTHPQWAGRLDAEAQARLIAHSAGLSGRNIDYLRRSGRTPAPDGVRDRGMERLLARVQALEAAG